MGEETVTIPREEYDELCRAKRKLIALENEGVDNWVGCDFAMEEFNKEEET